MATTAPDTLQRYLDNNEAAAFLRLSPRTLEKQRVTGGGPTFCRLGRRIVYALSDLQAYAEARRFANTAQADAGQR